MPSAFHAAQFLSIARTIEFYKCSDLEITEIAVLTLEGPKKHRFLKNESLMHTDV